MEPAGGTNTAHRSFYAAVSCWKVIIRLSSTHIRGLRFIEDSDCLTTKVLGRTFFLFSTNWVPSSRLYLFQGQNDRKGRYFITPKSHGFQERAPEERGALTFQGSDHKRKRIAFSTHQAFIRWVEYTPFLVDQAQTKTATSMSSIDPVVVVAALAEDLVSYRCENNDGPKRQGRGFHHDTSRVTPDKHITGCSRCHRCQNYAAVSVAAVLPRLQGYAIHEQMSLPQDKDPLPSLTVPCARNGDRATGDGASSVRQVQSPPTYKMRHDADAATLRISTDQHDTTNSPGRAKADVQDASIEGCVASCAVNCNAPATAQQPSCDNKTQHASQGCYCCVDNDNFETDRLERAASTLHEVTVVARLVDKALADRHGLSLPAPSTSVTVSPEQGPRRRRYQRRNSFVVHDIMEVLLPGFPALPPAATDDAVTTDVVAATESEKRKRECDYDGRVDDVDDSQQTKVARAG
jgi:hypothetical protein